MKQTHNFRLNRFSIFFKTGFIACFAMVPALVAPLPSYVAMAQETITPSHVYQVADTSYAYLTSFAKADFIDIQTFDVELSPRKPRHVLQKAQEVYIKVQTLRALNNLPTRPIQPIPVRAVTPADVKQSVQIILNDLHDLAPIYKTQPIEMVAFVDGKTPTNVYDKLVHCSDLLDQLGIPAVVPNDVYRIAETIAEDLSKVLKHENINKPFRLAPVSGKKPSDAYAQTRILLEKLDILTKIPGYEINGGVILSPQPKGLIRPLDVMNSLGDAMAEIGAIKNTLKIDKPTEFTQVPGGKTPSDVFAIVTKAQNMVDALIDNAGAKSKPKASAAPAPVKTTDANDANQTTKVIATETADTDVKPQ